MSPQADLVTLLAKRVTFTEPCMRCGKEISMTEAGHANLSGLANRGCCVLLWCDECHEEHDKIHRSAPSVSPRVLPLP